jgi:hypothetical protein
MKKTLFLIGLILLLAGGQALAAKTVNIDVNPSASTGGVSPDIDGVNAVYNYTLHDGQSVTDTIPVQVCMTGSPSGWTSIAVTFGNTTGNLNGVTLPGNQTFSSSTTVPPDDCRNLNVQVNSGQLSLSNPNVSQNFNANFNLQDTSPNPNTGPNKPQVAFADVKNFQIKVEVLPAVSNVSCFLTDSEGSFLADCNGEFVTDSGSDHGRFAIVANKKNIQVSTNPGQFYYNFVWKNTTGSEKTVDVNFDRYGVEPQGAQAIHSAIFNGYLSTVNPPAFDEANSNGIPDGTDDKALGILVPADSSLLVTYHLEWADKGNQLPADCAGACEDANQYFEITGTVSGTGITTESCTSGAYGYKK